MLPTLNAAPVIFFTAITALIVIAILAVILLRLLSIKPIDLRTEVTGHQAFDEANRAHEGLSFQLDILEDLDGDPQSLNQLADKVAITEMTRDSERLNMERQRELKTAQQEAVPHPTGVIVPQSQRLTN